MSVRCFDALYRKGSAIIIGDNIMSLIILYGAIFSQISNSCAGVMFVLHHQLLKTYSRALNYPSR